MKNWFFYLEASQLTIGHETLLKSVELFSPFQKMPVYLIIIINIYTIRSQNEIFSFSENITMIHSPGQSCE